MFFFFFFSRLCNCSLCTGLICSSGSKIISNQGEWMKDVHKGNVKWRHCCKYSWFQVVRLARVRSVLQVNQSHQLLIPFTGVRACCCDLCLLTCVSGLCSSFYWCQPLADVTAQFLLGLERSIWTKMHHKIKVSAVSASFSLKDKRFEQGLWK